MKNGEWSGVAGTWPEVGRWEVGGHHGPNILRTLSQEGVSLSIGPIIGGQGNEQRRGPDRDCPQGLKTNQGSATSRPLRLRQANVPFPNTAGSPTRGSLCWVASRGPSIRGWPFRREQVLLGEHTAHCSCPGTQSLSADPQPTARGGQW